MNPNNIVESFIVEKFDWDYVSDNPFINFNYDEIDDVDFLEELRSRFMYGEEFNNRLDELNSLMEFNGDPAEVIWGFYTGVVNDFGFKTIFITKEQYELEVEKIENRLNLIKQ